MKTLILGIGLLGLVAADKIDYKTWCERWQLTCQTTAPEPVPGDPPWTAQQWADAFTSAQAITQSSSRIIIRRQEIDDPRLQQVAQALKGEAALDGLKADLDRLKVLQVGLNGSSATQGSFHAELGLATEVHAKSALTVKLGTTVTVQPSKDGLHFTGLTLAGKDPAASSTLERIQVTQPNVLEWSGSGLDVEGVPIKRFIQDVFGLGRPRGAHDFGDFVKVLSPLVEWLVEGTRDLLLERASFEQLAAATPSLLPKGAVSSAGYLLAHLTRVESTAASRARNLLETSVDEAVSCNLGEDIELDLDAAFGVNSVTKLSESSVGITLYGISATPLKGLLHPTIALDQLVLEPTRIIVKNVPVIGDYVIDMTQGAQQDLKLTCPGSRLARDLAVSETNR